jgi:hypothetical protein
MHACWQIRCLFYDVSNSPQLAAFAVDTLYHSSAVVAAPIAIVLVAMHVSAAQIHHYALLPRGLRFLFAKHRVRMVAQGCNFGAKSQWSDGCGLHSSFVIVGACCLLTLCLLPCIASCRFVVYVLLLGLVVW